MKAIKDMNLAELADFVDSLLIHIYYRKRNDDLFVAKRLRELHEQTRWIPTSERMPTEADGPVIRCYDRYTRLQEFPATFINGVLREYAYDSYKGVMRWQEVSPCEYQYWQRGTSPEDKP